MKEIIVSILVIGLLLNTASLSMGEKGHEEIIETSSSSFLKQQHTDPTPTKVVGLYKKACFVEGNIRGPFRCFRIPGLIYSIESDSGGELSIKCSDYTIYQEGDFFKMTIVGWIGLFVLPLHNGYNLLSREFSGYAFMVYFEIY